MPEGIYLLGDQREVLFGDIQNVDADDAEDTEDDDEEVPECREYFDMGGWDAVVGSLGDCSRNGSRRGGELKSRHTVLSRNPMSAPCKVLNQSLAIRFLVVHKDKYPFLIMRARKEYGVVISSAVM